jgi:putative transposase
MGYLKIWVHLVWTTKNRERILIKEIRQDIFNHIKENAKNKGIYIDFINGHLEHVHCLISLGSGQNIDKILMLLKGESSFWINKNKLFRKKFEWQDEYFAVSVSESAVNRVRDYIKNQETHHKKKSFSVEYQ